MENCTLFAKAEPGGVLGHAGGLCSHSAGALDKGQSLLRDPLHQPGEKLRQSLARVLALRHNRLDAAMFRLAEARATFQNEPAVPRAA